MSYKRFIPLIILCFLVSSCYTRKLKEGEYLLVKNKIVTENSKIDKDKLSSVIKQRPNKKILLFVKFHLMLYNSMDSTKVANRELRKIKRKNKRIARKNIRIKRKNERNEKKNERIRIKNQNKKTEWRKKLKTEKDTIPYLTSETFDSFGEKILYSIGEAPVILDKEIIDQTDEQLEVYLIRKGFFDNSVTDSIKYLKFLGIPLKKAVVYYKIKAGNPYIIKSITYNSEDSLVLAKIKRINKDSKIKVNSVFDIDKLDEERERLATYLLNDGYYKFNKNYIKYFIDSTVGDRQVAISLDLDLFKEKVRQSDSIFTINHSQYYISKIKINYVQDATSSITSEFVYKGIDVLVQGKNDISSGLFYRSLFLKPGQLYSKHKQEQTFRKFTSLGVFKSVNIFTEVVSDEKPNELILTIKLNGAYRKEMKAEGNGTTSGSNIGIEGSIQYNHKNVFRGAEVFHVGLSGSLESQPLLVNDNTSNNSNIPVEFNTFSDLFNTIEFGPEVSLTIPSLLFFNTNEFKNVSNTKTIFTASLNYQRRLNRVNLDYKRGIQEVSFGYIWTVNNKFTHQLDPLSFSAVEVDKSAEFQRRISSLNDKLLEASFNSHIISATRYRFVYSKPKSAQKGRFSMYYDGSVESAGNILNTFYKLTNKPKDPTLDAYKIAGIQFAQYVKTQHDFRLYHKVNDKNSLVLRMLGGVGVPLENLSDALPFEKSFFAGGSDKNRAWKARTLGPGSFRDSVLRYDKIGQILLEGNVEYRFDLLGFLDGALFIDAGNIWLINEDSLRPGSQFKFNTFASQIAIGAGFGIRVDLDFFLFRLDIGFPLKNPALVEGEKWFFQKKDEYNRFFNGLTNTSNIPQLYPLQLNFGIGFPF